MAVGTILYNLPMAIRWAYKSNWKSMPVAERLDIAVDAVMNAVDAFNVGLGNKFSTYAVRAILQHLIRHGERADKRARLIHQEGQSDDGDSGLVFVSDARAVQPADAAALSELADHLDRLPERERYVVRHRYGLDGLPPQTLDEVGRRMALTKERVRQLEAQGVERLRALMDAPDPRKPRPRNPRKARPRPGKSTPKAQAAAA